VYEALSSVVYEEASAFFLTPVSLVQYAALSYSTSACGLKLLAYEASSY
jgi:hypothetical protein